MKTQLSRILPLSLALLLPLAVSAQEAAAPTESVASPVTVELGDFNTMHEVRKLNGIQRRDTERQIKMLADWLTKAAQKNLAAGQSLHITLTDVDLAGDYEPSTGIDMQHVRVVREMYPPNIDLSWRLTDANGANLDEGAVGLRDMGFLSANSPTTQQSLTYEKRMLRKWLSQHFPKKA